MTADESHHRTPEAPASPSTASEPSSRARFAVMVLAVALAAAGILALAAILLTEFLQGDVWPGFVVASYVCLPVAFLLMVSLVVWSFISRRRS